MSSKLGLTGVPNGDLQKLLRSVHRGDIACPLEPAGLACIGLQHRSEALLNTLRNLDEPAVRAVLVCVIAERTRLLPS